MTCAQPAHTAPRLVQKNSSGYLQDQTRFAAHAHLFALSRPAYGDPATLSERNQRRLLGCITLHSLSLPRQLRYIGRKAFGVAYRRSQKTAWRRPYAAYNAFEDCHALNIAWWLHYLPPNGSDWMVPPSHRT